MARIALNTKWNKVRSKIFAISRIVADCNSNFLELYADKLVVYPIAMHATKTDYNVFVATQSYTVNSIRFVADVAQGAALTGTVVKVTGTNAPVAATTPLHTSTFNMNGTIHSVQTLTLTSTVADLTITAGQRIGVKLSGAPTAGSGLLMIRMTAI